MIVVYWVVAFSLKMGIASYLVGFLLHGHQSVRLTPVRDMYMGMCMCMLLHYRRHRDNNILK